MCIRNNRSLQKMLRYIKYIIRRLHISYLRLLSNNVSIRPTDITLIVAPHPDDEVIGCGGLIARMVNEGNIPHIIVMTGGEGSHNGCCDTGKGDIVNARRKLTRNALAILGVPESHIHELDFPDGGISSSHPQTQRLKELIENVNPRTVLVPHWGEGWPDHIKTAEIVKGILQSGTEIWEYCVWMWYYNVWRGLDWRNGATLSMTQQEHDLKLRAMAAYTTPLAPCGKPWSGVLPPLFIKANQWDKELYFKVR